jgi:hypothetical protein
MDHVVYLDANAKELDLLLSAKKMMIIRGATGRKLPYGRVNQNDVLYFINNNADGYVRAKAKVKGVHNSEKLTEEESAELVDRYQDKLQLTRKQYERWAGKRYLVLIEISDAENLEPFRIARGNYGNMDDWLPIEQIEKVRLD